MAKRKSMKPVRAWGGFYDDELFIYHTSTTLYRTREAALEEFDDVRPIIIREAPRKRKRK